MAPPSPSATTTTTTTSSSSSSILLRNRENQRASRARRKDYIEDLERRVRQSEREGAAATVAVQAAARKVAEENVWLRALVAQYGVDVDEYLERSRAQAGQGVQSVKPLPLQRKRKGSEMSVRELEAARTLGEIDSPKHLVPVAPWEAVQSPKVVRELRDLPTPEDSNGSETSAELPAMQEYHYQPVSVPEIRHQTEQVYETTRDPRQADFTPCEEAAHIIASMRGHEDADSVKTELGCSSSQKCSIKNMTIFQLGDVDR